MAFFTWAHGFFRKVAQRFYSERRDTLFNNELYSEDPIIEPSNQRVIKLIQNSLIFIIKSICKFFLLVILLMCFFVKQIAKLVLYVSSKTIRFFNACVRVVVQKLPFGRRINISSPSRRRINQPIWARNILRNRRQKQNYFYRQQDYGIQKQRDEAIKRMGPKYFASNRIRWETRSPQSILNKNNVEQIFRAGRGVYVNRVGRGEICVSNEQGILGRGGFGTVRIGTISLEDDMGRTIQQMKVAIKAIKYGYSMNDIKNEVTALLRCYRHPSIPEVHFLVIDSGEVLIGMDYCNDGDLSQHGFVDMDTVRRWFLQIVEAICHCHERGIAHLDIKPNNILVDNGDVMLSDFGVSLVLPSERPTSNQFQIARRRGTPAYMAPEVAKITGPYDARKADVWSLGILLYEMVTGRYPFRGTLVFPSKEIPDGAKRLIARMLNVNPNYRPSMQDIRLDPWLSAGW